MLYFRAAEVERL